MTPGFAFFPNYPALLCPVVSVGVMVAWDVRLSPRVCQWPVVCAWSTGSHTVRKLIGETWNQRQRASSLSCVWGEISWITKVSQGQSTDSITVHRCLPCLPPRRWETNSSKGARRHLSSWYLGAGLGLCVLSFRPSWAVWLSPHNLIYLLCLKTHRDSREGGSHMTFVNM